VNGKNIYKRTLTQMYLLITRARRGRYMVVVRFIVAKDGSISEVVAETNHGYGMEKEVVRVIKMGPKWTPAMQNGNIVKAYRRQPVTFMIE
jgi:periplasmic protein TonB